MLMENPLILEQQIKKEKEAAAERSLRRAERIDAKLAQERDKAKQEKEMEKVMERGEKKEKERLALQEKLIEAKRYTERLNKVDAERVFEEARTAFEKGDFKKAQTKIFEVNSMSYYKGVDEYGVGRKIK